MSINTHKSLVRVGGPWAVMLAAGVLGCSHTKPGEMSAEEHRREVYSHLREAQSHEAQYDPNAAPAAALRPVPIETGPGGPTVEYWVYNTTEHHLADAAVERDHAMEHARAAQALEKFESAECQGIDPVVRRGCPLLNPYVTQVTETAGGVELKLKPNAPGASMVQRMRCHLAFARTRGFEGVPYCPLYFKGVDIQLSKDGSCVNVQGESPAVAAEIRQRARQQFGSRQARK